MSDDAALRADLQARISAATLRAARRDARPTSKHDQSHVLAHWEALDAPQRASLAAQVEALFPADPLPPGFVDVSSVFRDSLEMSSAPPADVEPPAAADITTLPPFGAAPRDVEAAGQATLAAGKGAVIILAGGSGTRLGVTFPKGMLTCPDLQMPKSLFQLQAEKLVCFEREMAAKHGAAAADGPLKGFRVPLLYMTSPQTDAKTRAFFAENDNFGLAKEQVVFFQQSTMPCFDGNGKIVLANPGAIAEAPGGNAGIYAALAAAGVLDLLAARGTTHCQVGTVDNILTQVPDLALFGFGGNDTVDVAVKTVPKAAASEAVGVFARRTFPSVNYGGATGAADDEEDAEKKHWGVVEYTEIGAELAAQTRPESGDLQFNAANVAIHLLSLPFLRRAAAAMHGWSYYHVAHKPIPTQLASAHGGDAKDETIPGVKLEAFIFDLFQLAPASAFRILQGARDEEFSAIKNAETAAKDTPATAVRALHSLHAGWVLHALAASGAATESAAVGAVEISPLVATSASSLSAAFAADAALAKEVAAAVAASGGGVVLLERSEGRTVVTPKKQ